MSTWRRYVRFWGPDVDADVDDELRYHIEMRTQDFLARGYSEAEAREAVRQVFGDPDDVARRLRDHDRRKLRQARRIDMLHDLTQDVRYGIRQLRNAPRFTAAVVCVLALGIGANSAIFSAIDAAFLRPLPFADPARLVTVSDVELPWALSDGHPKAAPEIGDLQADSAAFTSVGAYATGGLNLVGGAVPERATISYVTADFFRTIGRAPANGRGFVREEFESGGPQSIIVSDALATRQFGGAHEATGRSVTLNGVGYHVVGVMPPRFAFPAATDVWIPLPLPLSLGIMGAFRNFVPSVIVARLAPGVTPLQAAQQVDALRRHYRQKITADDTPMAKLVQPLRDSLVGNRRTALLVLMGSAALLLLIACANVTNLMLVRAATRERELAMRAVLGATRIRLVRQLVVESFLLSIAAGLVASLVAYASVALLTAAITPSLAAVAPPRLDVRVLGFTLLIATVTSFGFGLWPALGASRPNLGETMKSGGWGATRRAGATARGALVVAEVALSVMLLVGAGLMIESLHALLQTDVGMRPEHVVTGRLVLSGVRYPRQKAATFLADVVRRVRESGGVEGAAAVSALPMERAGGIALRVVPEDAPADESRMVPGAYLIATPGYFATIGATLEGSDLPAVADSSHPVAVINRAMARKLWPGQNPIGRRMLMGTFTRTVIGVVGDIRTTGLDEDVVEQMYWPMAESPQGYAAIVARGPGDARALLSRIESAVHAADPLQPVYALRTLEDVIDASVASRRTNTLLLSMFGAVALILAGVGVYGVLSFGVAQRTREIGVRVALGAQRVDVLTLVLRQGLALTAVGVLLGLTGAYALSRLLASILYQVSPHDARVFIAAPLTLGGIALVAVLLPAVRATKLDPMVALRLE